MANKPVSQSRTMWVKAGTVVNGKKVPKGYVAQLGKPEKKVTGSIKMVKKTGGVAAGKTQEYKAGRRVKPAGPSSGPSGGPTPPSGPSAAQRAEAARQKRIAQNKGVKSGTIRPSAKGGGVRKYNAKTGRWDMVVSATGTPTAGYSRKAQATGTPTAGYSKSQTGSNRRGITVDEAKSAASRAGSAVSRATSNVNRGGQAGQVAKTLATMAAGPLSLLPKPQINVGGRPQNGATKQITRGGKKVTQRYNAKTNKWTDVR